MSDSDDPATRAKAVLKQLADLAECELPKGYTLELKLGRIGERFVGDEVYIIGSQTPGAGAGE